jgi:cellulose synthase/poly-beta-1,6-N-acetylglucosamine synthase-like glycosyltransferase
MLTVLAVWFTWYVLAPIIFVIGVLVLSWVFIAGVILIEKVEVKRKSIRKKRILNAEKTTE